MRSLVTILVTCYTNVRWSHLANTPIYQALTLPFQSWSGKLKGACKRQMRSSADVKVIATDWVQYSSGQRRRCGRRCRRPNNNIMMKELLWFSLSASLSASVQRWVHNKCHCLSIGCYGLVIDFVKLTIMRSISLAVFICHRSSKLLHRWAHSRFTPKHQVEKEEEGSALGILRQRKFPILQSTSMKSTMI